MNNHVSQSTIHIASVRDEDGYDIPVFAASDIATALKYLAIWKLENANNQHFTEITHIDEVPYVK